MEATRFLLANVKVCRSEMNGQMQLTIGKAVAHDFGLDFGSRAVHGVEACAPLPPGTSPLIPCKLSQIVMQAHQGLGARYVDGQDLVFCCGGLLIVFVSGTQRSKVCDLGSGKAITSYYKDMFAVANDDSDTVYVLQPFAQESRLTDFQLDRRMAMVFITGVSSEVSSEVFIVEAMDPWVVAEAKDTGSVLLLPGACR